MPPRKTIGILTGTAVVQAILFPITAILLGLAAYAVLRSRKPWRP